MLEDALGVGEGATDELGHSHLVNGQVGVGRNDRAAGKVDALAREVATEAAGLALEALTEAADGLLVLLLLRRAKEEEGRCEQRTICG